MSSESKVTCERCGKCCLINVTAILTDDDVERWKWQGRDDILLILEKSQAVWAGDHLVSADNGRYLSCCPFLEHTGNHYTCTIYETRPSICRTFVPGSSDLCPQYDFDAFQPPQIIRHE